jgi:hypothetical protein
VALAIRGEETLVELSQQFDVHGDIAHIMASMDVIDVL